MKFITVLLLSLFALSSCNQSEKTASDNQSYDISALTVLDSSFKEFKVAFDKSIGQVGLIVNENNVIQYYPLGLFHNTENSIPESIKIDTLTKNIYLFTVVSHLKTGNMVGNNINLVAFNTQSKKVTSIHSFNNLGSYADSLQYDTMKNIQFFESKFVRLNLKDSFTFDIQEFKPFKHTHSKTAQNQRYLTTIQQHAFNLKGL